MISCQESKKQEKRNEAKYSKDSVEYSIASFLNDPYIPSCIKDLYTHKLNPNENDSCAFQLIDSLYSRDRLRQPYYFLTLTRTFEAADASYSEAVCQLSMEYILNNTAEFLDQFLYNENLTRHDLEMWADNTMMELIDFADGDGDKAVTSYINRLKQKSDHLNNQQKLELNDLIRYMNQYKP